MTGRQILNEILGLLNRHARVISQVVGLGCLATLLLAGNQPRLYQATEKIQVVQAGIDQRYAHSLVEGFSDRQLNLILQQVLSRDSIAEIAEAYQLFAGMGDLSLENRVALLRNAVNIEVIDSAIDAALNVEARVLSITAEMAQPSQARDLAHEIGHRLMRFSTRFRVDRARAALDFAEGREAQLLEKTQALTQYVEVFRLQTELHDTRSVALRKTNISQWERELNALSGGGIELQRMVKTGSSEAAADRKPLSGQSEELDGPLQSDRRQELKEKIHHARSDLAELTLLQRQLNQMEERFESASDFRAKAEGGVLLETRRMSDRLIVLEPAAMPESPVGDQKRFVLNGLLLSVLGALSLAVLLDRRNPVIATAGQMRRKAGLQPIVSIPVSEARRG